MEDHVPSDPAHGQARHPVHHPAGVRKLHGQLSCAHYLNLVTLSTKYVSMNSKYTGGGQYCWPIIMMVFGVAIMLLNQMSLRSRKNYTTVTGKVGADLKIKLGRVGRYLIALVLVVCDLLHQYLPHRLLRL